MLHLVTLRKVDGTTVIAFVEARTEEDAKLKALNTANGIAKDNKSRVLMSGKPLKVVSVEVWENASNRIVMGLKRYEALVASHYGLEENRMVGFKGEKSVYNSIIKTLMPREELRVFIRDLDQVPVEVKVKKPEVDANGNIKLTIAEAIDEKRISFKEFYEVLIDNISGTDDINSTEIIEQYLEEKEAEDIEVSHIREALERGCSTDIWRIWLGNSMETPEPIETKQDLADILYLDENDFNTKLVFNIRNR